MSRGTMKPASTSDEKRFGLTADQDLKLRGDPFPAQSSVLDEQALTAMLEDYRIPPVVSCRFLTRGDADIYRVKTKGGNHYLKVYRPPARRTRVEAEASFVAALSAAGVAVVKPVLREDGHYGCEARALEGMRPMLLFEEAPAPLAPELDWPLLGKIGSALARLHEAADDMKTDCGIGAMDCKAFLAEKVGYTSRFLSE